MSVSLRFRICLAGLTLAANTALADEVCVVCTDPPTTYRCQLEGSNPAGPITAGTQVLCIKEIATRGNHKSCSISRDQSAGTCAGTLVVVAKPDLGPLKAPSPKSAEPASQIPGAPAPPPPAPSQAIDGSAPPATMEDLAKQAAKQTQKDWDNTTKAAGDGVQKAGDSVGSAVKKSWKCLSSLFTAC